MKPSVMNPYVRLQQEIDTYHRGQVPAEEHIALLKELVDLEARVKALETENTFLSLMGASVSHLKYRRFRK